VADLFGQGDFDVRFDWGPVGAKTARADVALVVDVLSFSTSVTVAVERGMKVYPHGWNGSRAQAFAAEHDAILATGQLEATRDGGRTAPSLSPAALRACTPIPRLVLPSPNGSTIAAALQREGTEVAVGCLRNAEAAAKWLASALDDGDSAAVVAAGERWRGDDSLRFALEDHLGAGAVLSHLVDLGFADRMSPESATAAQLLEAGREQLSNACTTALGHVSS
jgi:2-phosphosulfolactate phosphatase